VSDGNISDTWKLSEQISFKDAKHIVQKVDDIAQKKGTDRSALYREAMRYWLGANSHLTEDEKKALGVQTASVKRNGAP
jgi:metal-responsive CopG/Arc/MetJ family transcriptional regulator